LRALPAADGRDLSTMKRKPSTDARRDRIEHALLVGVSLPAEFEAAGVARSTGYRYVRALLGVPIAEAKARLLADELAAGAPVLEAFAKIGVSRATGYRLLKRVNRPR
jgi:hypothetical protein